MKNLFLALFTLLLFNTAIAQHYKKDGTPDMRYKENKVYSPKSSYSYSKPSSTYYHNSNYNYSVARDNNGKIKRSPEARYQFMKQTGYPKGRKGYVIDHIVPLKKGGCDCPSNMQWQTKEAAKQKDKWE